MSVFLFLLSITSTALTALLGLFVSAIIGFFIGRFFSSNGGEWKTKFEQKNKAYIELDKKFKSEGKHLNRLKQESQNWKHKFESLEETHIATLKELETLKAKKIQKPGEQKLKTGKKKRKNTKTTIIKRMFD